MISTDNIKMIHCYNLHNTENVYADSEWRISPCFYIYNSFIFYKLPFSHTRYVHRNTTHNEISNVLQNEPLPQGFNPLNPELNPICYVLALLGAHHFLHVRRIRVKSLTFRRLMSYIYIYIYIYGAPILDVSRSHTTTQHSRQDSSG